VSRSGTALLPRRHSRMIVVVCPPRQHRDREDQALSVCTSWSMGGRQVNVRTRPDGEPTGPSLDVIVDALLTDGPVLLGSCGEGLRCRRLPGVRTHQRRLQQSAALSRKYCQERRALAESASVMRWPWSPIRVPSHLAGPPGSVGTLPVASPHLSVRSSAARPPRVVGRGERARWKPAPPPTPCGQRVHATGRPTRSTPRRKAAVTRTARTQIRSLFR
jgi:hypothetical protein